MHKNIHHVLPYNVGFYAVEAYTVYHVILLFRVGISIQECSIWQFHTLVFVLCVERKVPQKTPFKYWIHSGEPS